MDDNDPHDALQNAEPDSRKALKNAPETSDATPHNEGSVAPKKRVVSNKRARVTTGDANPGPPHSVRRRSGKLSGITKVPVDVFAEITVYLLPLDLLRLSRTNKFIRSIVLSKSLRYIWTASLGNVKDLPKCPVGMTEPAYASLIFDQICSAEGCRKRVLKADFAFMLRLCPEHTSAATVDYFEARNTLSSLLPPEDGEFSSEHRMWTTDALHFDGEHSVEGMPRDNDLQSVVELLKTAKEHNKADPEAYRAAVCSIMDERSKLKKQLIKLSENLKVWSDAQKAGRKGELGDLKKQRKQAIVKKLLALGWDAADMEDNQQFEQKEYHSLISQPATLTEKIWQGIQPRLESILAQRKSDRLAAERALRQEERVRELQARLTELAFDTKDSPEAQRLRSCDAWLSTFPSTSEQIWRVPALVEFLEDDQTPVTKAVFDAKRDHVLAGVRVFQMQTRRAFVKLLRMASGPDGAPYRLERSFIRTCRDDVDMDVLEREDPGNLDWLLHPTAVFRISFHARHHHVARYPLPLPYNEHARMGYFYYYCRDLYRNASRMVSAFGPDSRSLEQAIARDSKFVCECCPAHSQQFYGKWAELVSHYVEEAEHYSSLPNGCGGSVAWVNTHEHPRFVVVEDHAAYLEARGVDPTEEQHGYWHCRYCPRLGRGASPHLRFARSHMSTPLAILHLKYRHQIDAEVNYAVHLSDLDIPSDAMYWASSPEPLSEGSSD